MWLLAGRKFDLLADVPPLAGYQIEHTNYLAALSALEVTMVTANTAAIAAGHVPYDYLQPSKVTAAANV